MGVKAYKSHTKVFPETIGIEISDVLLTWSNPLNKNVHKTDTLSTSTWAVNVNIFVQKY